MQKKSILNFKQKKESGEKITMLTAYDYSMAKLVDSSGVDAILVGDSLGMVMLGYESTVSVTMDEMLHHCKAVKRGVKDAFLIGDMPFLSYQISDQEAVVNAGRFLKEAGCDAVKVEGGDQVCSRVKAISEAGIPVLGHLGLTPQTVSKLGGYKVQGKDEATAKKILNDAKQLEDSGCFSVILECIPQDLSKKITETLTIPTIGIGAGKHCDGQVLVTHDVIGFYNNFTPKFVKQYTKINDSVINALKEFKKETESGDFPGAEQSY